MAISIFSKYITWQVLGPSYLQFIVGYIIVILYIFSYINHCVLGHQWWSKFDLVLLEGLFEPCGVFWFQTHVHLLYAKPVTKDSTLVPFELIFFFNLPISIPHIRIYVYQISSLLHFVIPTRFLFTTCSINSEQGWGHVPYSSPPCCLWKKNYRWKKQGFSTDLRGIWK